MIRELLAVGAVALLAIFIDWWFNLHQSHDPRELDLRGWHKPKGRR